MGRRGKRTLWVALLFLCNVLQLLIGTQVSNLAASDFNARKDSVNANQCKRSWESTPFFAQTLVSFFKDSFHTCIFTSIA